MSDELFGYDETEDETEATATARLERIEQVRDTFDRVFRSDDGKQVMVFLKDFCRQSRASYVPSEPLETAYYEGRRSVMLLIMKYMNMDDDEIIQLASRQAQRRVR